MSGAASSSRASRGGQRDWGTILAVAVVLGAFVWSAVEVGRRRVEAAAPGTVTVRLAHWQLEASVRQAFDEMARDYARDVRPGFRLVQLVIPDSTYGQWASTQLVGGTAPDVVELWKGLPRAMWVSLINRYFVPLGDTAERPNPHNRGTEFAATSLRRTYRDDMRSGYVEELQGFYNIPLSQFSVRVFYNRDLLRRLTGLDRAPTDYRAFLDACRAIAAKRDDRGEPYIAIAAGGGFHLYMWETRLFDIPTWGAHRLADFNRDGYTTPDELFTAFRTGRLGFDFPGYGARFAMTRQVAQYFQPGFNGLTRDEAVFLFAQQRAVFMPTGTWDARSLQEQTRGRFEIGVVDFPRPLPDDPEFAGLFEGPMYDYPAVGINFGIARTSPHPDVALDFLLYCASRPGNEKFNRIVGWIPGIRGAPMDPFLDAFEPHLQGVNPMMDFNLGGETAVRWSQLMSLFMIGQLDFEGLAKQFTQFYLDRGQRDFDETVRNWRRGAFATEQMLAGLRGEALHAGSAGDAEEAWVRYRALMDERLLRWEVDRARLMALHAHRDAAGRDAPHAYSPAVIERVRQRLAATGATREGPP